MNEEEIEKQFLFEKKMLRSIPDSSSYKSKYISTRIEAYTQHGLEDKIKFWEDQLDKLKEYYPAIHNKSEKS